MSFAKLSPRETEVLQLMCAGLKQKEITYRLKISNGTVGSLRTRMTKKTGCKTQAQLGVWAARNGYVEN